MGWIFSIGRAVVSAIVAQAAIQVCHAFDFYPERWLANSTMGLLSNRATLWLTLVIITILVWLMLELVARQLIHRRRILPKSMPLLEAARIVFDQTKDSVSAQMARAEGNDEAALRWYCYMLIGVKADGVTRLMEMTGTRPPSRVQEHIPFDRPPPHLQIRDGAAILVELPSKRIVAENLTVPSSSIPGAVSFILGLDDVGRSGPSNIIVNAS